MLVHRPSRSVLAAVLIAAFAAGGCGVIESLGPRYTEDWHKTYSGVKSIDISDINGKIEVEAAPGDTVEVTATKIAHGASESAAKENLARITIHDDSTGGAVALETRVDRGSGFLSTGNLQVDYHLKVPAGATLHLVTTNGTVDVTGAQGKVVAETTNGAIHGHNISGAIDASTTNGAVDVEAVRIVEGGVKLSCTNGGIKFELPHDAKADLDASVTNGGVTRSNLTLETTEDSRRHVQGRLNGGGPKIDIETTNGGVSITGR